MPKRPPPPTPRADLLGLLRAAKRRPDDDAPRLILADWLDEYGDESDRARAEFVRLQLHGGPADRAALIARDHRADWLGPFKTFRSGSATFERGLLHLMAEPRQLTGRAGERLVEGEAVGWLERLLVRGAPRDGMPDLLASAVLPHAGALALPGASLGVAATRQIADCSALTNLASLDLNYNHIGNAGAEALADSPHLGGLRTLDLWINKIGPRGGRALARSETLRQVRSLNLGGNALGPEGIAALAESPLLAGVETFLAWGNAVGPAGAQALAAADLLRMHTLYLNENRLGPKGVAALLRWRRIDQLKGLSLWGNALGPAGAHLLAEVPLRRLETLLLSENRLGDEGVIALAGSPHLAGLTRLDLHDNDIFDPGARALLDSPNLSRLTELNVSDNPISLPLREALRARFPQSCEE